MKQKLSLFFLTLVAPTFILNAAPHEFSEDHKKKKTNSSTSTSLENKDFVISTLPKPSKEELQKENQVEFYPYIQSMSPRISFKINAQDVKDTEAVYGLLYLIPRFKSPQWEAGADLTGSGNGSIHLSKRFIINERDYFRPYYKYGLNLSIMPQEKLATFLNVKNYGFRAGIGLEDLLRHPMSLRLDLETVISLNSSYLLISFGYSWGW